MYYIQGLNLNKGEDNPNVTLGRQCGPFQVVEYKQDLSVHPGEAMNKYYFAKMGGRMRKLIINCDNGVILQPGEMEMIIGKDVKLTSGFKGVGDIASKFVRGKLSGEKTTMPEYRGHGIVITEPTYKYIGLIDVSQYNGGIVLEDGLFLACECSLRQRIISRRSLSSAALGNEGLFNLCLEGVGYCALELPCPMTELVAIQLQNDVVKIDGSMAIAWSPSLEFTVEKAATSLFGSAVSGEGLVNVYRGTGVVLMRPVLG